MSVLDSAVIRWSQPKNCGVCLCHVKGHFWKSVFFLHAYKYGSKNTFLTSDFQLQGNLSFPHMPLSVLPKEGQHTQGHSMDDTGILYHGQWLCAWQWGWELQPQGSFHLNSCLSSAPPVGIPPSGLTHGQAGPSTANSGGHGQKQSEMTSCAIQRGWAFLQPPA